ncbi:MAG: hypothetical protein FWF01_01850 [Alphaproteobacteria bacterium]|nr:hypothetical protein [Alphaproteobacteria bacterium]
MSEEETDTSSDDYDDEPVIEYRCVQERWPKKPAPGAKVIAAFSSSGVVNELVEQIERSLSAITGPQVFSYTLGVPSRDE